MFELDFAYSALLVICLIAACSFEFVNGFHEPLMRCYGNLYQFFKALGRCDMVGVLELPGSSFGWYFVAVGIINLLPVETLVDQNIAHSLSMVVALLLTAIFWNLGTWYLGIPCSSSHTLIGSILGVGCLFTFTRSSR